MLRAGRAMVLINRAISPMDAHIYSNPRCLKVPPVATRIVSRRCASSSVLFSLFFFLRSNCFVLDEQATTLHETGTGKLCAVP
jgi:hypothetical protein